MTKIFDITFEEIFADFIAVYQDVAGIVLERQDAERLVAQVVSGVIYNFGSAWLSASDQNFLKGMTQGQLDDYGIFFGVARIASTPATSVVRFTFVETLPAATFIYENTVVVGSNENGTYNFRVKEDVYLPKGIDFFDIVVEEFTTTGNSGANANDIEIGEIDTLDESQFSYSFLDSVVNVVESSGGQISETDDSYRDRLKLASEKFSTAGTAESYTSVTKALDAGIVKVGILKSGYTIQLYILPKNYDGSFNLNLIGDGASQLDNLTLSGLTLSNTDSGKLYWSLIDVAGTRTFQIYSNSAKTVAVANYVGADGIGVAITQIGGSGISGTIDLAYTTDDTDTTNEILSSMQLVGIVDEAMYPSSGVSKIRPLNDIVTTHLISGVTYIISDVSLEISTTNIDSIRNKALLTIDIFMNNLKNQVGKDVVKSQIAGLLSAITGVSNVTVEFNSTPATTGISIDNSQVALGIFDPNNLNITVA